MIMKKKLLFLSIILMSAISGNAQLKLYSDGKLTLGNVQLEGYYNTHWYGWGHYYSFDTKWGKSWYKICLGAADPRISGNNGQIVFFDSESSQFNSIQVKNVYNYSDARAKTNITPIKNATDLVLNLNPVTYNFKNEEGIKLRKSAITGEKMKEIGFLAQDVEQVLPEAVHEDEEGNKLINYSAIIPLLTESFKELTEKVYKLQEEIEELKSTKVLGSSNSKSLLAKNNKPILYQNAPNPFSEQTIIGYNIPVNFSTANICFFNLQGKMLLKKTINNGVGEGSISLNANELGAGIYLYTLVVNNAVIDTKRLLITN